MNKILKIAIASGKGGTGKTLLSTNLSYYLSNNYRVMLTDLDVEEPNSSIFLKINLLKTENAYKMVPEWDEKDCVLCGKCVENCNFNSIIRLGKYINVFDKLCHSCYACSELCPTNSLKMKKHKIGDINHYKANNFNLVEGIMNIGEEQAVPLIHQTQKFSINNCQETEIQIIDCPPGNSCPLVAAVKDADYVILITEPTPFGLNDLKIAIETINQLNIRFGVIINKYGIGDEEIEKYCAKKRIKILSKINYDRKIAVNYAKGKLVVDEIEHFRNSITQIANKIEKDYKKCKK